MTAKEIAEQVQGRVVCGEQNLHHEVHMACSSDLLSDVLTLKPVNVLLVTGLCSMQTIRTAEMADIRLILFVRGKKVTPDMKKLAEQLDMILIETPFSNFRTCGILFHSGIQYVY
jgi:predicted transcriptional regulator